MLVLDTDGLELDRWYPDADGLFALSLAARV